MKFKRIFLMILDSLGVGEAEDSINYNDQGSNTLGHIKDNYDLFIPNLKKLGFLYTLNMKENNETEAYYTIAKPTNPGKDTLNGHYEIMGVKNDIQFKDFSDKGFPRELLIQIQAVTGRKLIGNVNGNGSNIINDLGDLSIEHHGIIIYTSNGSNLQIAAHESIIPITKLYEYGEAIRKLVLKEEWKVGRVIVRTFAGNKKGSYKFTNDRQVFTVKPPTKSIMNFLSEKELSVISIGKIDEVFEHEGITKTIKAKNNQEALNKFNDIMNKNFTGLCAVNLNDFDIEYGHKRDIEGYGKAIEELDVEIPMIINKLETDDLLIITADHGCDPSFPGTNHTRENVPVIIYGRNLKNPKKLDVLESMADIGATIADNFNVNKPFIGNSFLDKLK